MPMARACRGLAVVALVLLGTPAAQGRDATMPGAPDAERRIDVAAGATVPLPISPPAADYRFVRLVLPAQFTLSRGLKLGQAWFVSVADLPALALVPPPNFSERRGWNSPSFAKPKAIRALPAL